MVFFYKYFHDHIYTFLLNFRSQLYLSRQLAQLHPALTMPMFSEICHRLQTARPSNIKCLLYYLLPWLYNMELVDPNVCAGAITETDTDKNISTGNCKIMQ